MRLNEFELKHRFSKSKSRRGRKLATRLGEGPNDPSIFKAIFLAGGPGSGKSFAAKRLLTGHGLKVVNSDDVYEVLMQKRELPLDPDTIASPMGQEIRARAKELTDLKQGNYIDGRLGLIIDGTGKDVAKYEKMKKQLDALGYDSMMLFVNTSEEVAQQRNQQRARSLKPELVKQLWSNVQNNIMKFQQLFGAANFYVVDNSGGLEDPDRKANFDKVEREVTRFVQAPPAKRQAVSWLKSFK